MPKKLEFPTEVSQAVGIAVQHLRRQRRWSRQALAVRANLTYDVIRMIESPRPAGQRRPTSVDELVALAGVFQVHYSALMPPMPAPDDLDYDGLKRVLQDVLDHYGEGRSDGHL